MDIVIKRRWWYWGIFVKVQLCKVIYLIPLNAIVKKDEKLMTTFDQINQRMGKGAIQFAAEGVVTGSEWQMNRNMLSPRATTRWGELKKVG